MEMLVTVALLALLSIVVGVSMTGMFSRQELKKFEEYKTTLENAACVYAQSYCGTNNCSITTPSLITAGMIRKNLTNPITGESVEKDTSVIRVTYSNGERICTYPE